MRAPIQNFTLIKPESILETMLPTPLKKSIEGGYRVTHNASDCHTPTLTIVTVTYNCCDQLAETANSVLAVHRDDIDYIVVDGGSSDRTVDILRGYGDSIKYWLSEPDEGIYDAMNKAVRLASPDSYILFLGAGDKVLRLPDPVTIDSARASGTEILYGDVLIGKRLFRSSFSAKLIYRNTLHHQGLLIRRGSQPEPWFNESLRIYADWDMNLSLFRRQVRADHLGYTVAYAEPDGVSAKLHLLEIAKLVGKQCGLFSAVLAVLYHGSLHSARYKCRLFSKLS